MKQSNNPIIESSHFESLYPPKTRFDEIEKILSFVKKGASCQLIGLPGTGKSNLLGLLSYNKSVRLAHLGENQKWFHFVYMDFSEVKKRSFADIIKFMTISLAYSLSERNLSGEGKKVNLFLSEVKSFEDDLILFQALKKSIDYLSIEKELTIVFLFDRFDQYIPNINDAFFSNLKILRNRAKYRFSCIFSLNRELAELVDPFVLSDFYEFVAENIAYLNLLDKEGLTFRLSYLEKIMGKKLDPKLNDEIVMLTSGHGKLTRLAWEAVLSEEGKVGDLATFLASKKSIRGALFEIWTALTPQEQKSLKEQVANDFLEKIGLTRNGRLTIPLLKSLLETLVSQTAEKLTYDSQKNEIVKGEENLTEKLSPSEFRLLRFFLLNNGRICEKNEIIENVWKDSKTQEGVTDQALDQIVYRLRKKIEDDPNNPKFIQTIKGRGYKISG